MKIFAINEKRLAPAGHKSSQYGRHPMRSVQRAHQAEVARILRSTGAQAKLTIGQPNDKYEQEADRVAEQVMRMSGAARDNPISGKPRIQRQCGECGEEVRRQPIEEEEELLQAKHSSGNSGSVLGSDVSAQISAVRQGVGAPLPNTTRNFFEPRFGQDFSNVRIHADTNAAASAQSINARAYTLGQDIVFGSGQYEPHSQSGKHLLAHELTHVIQQGSNVIRRFSPPTENNKDFYRPDYSQLLAALNAVPLESPNHDTTYIAPPTNSELTALTDTEYESLTARVDELLAKKSTGAMVQEYNQEKLQNWRSALTKGETESRERRDRISDSGNKAREFSKFVKKKATPRTKHWYANMLPKAIEDLDNLLKTGSHLAYSDPDIKKHGYLLSVRAVMHSSVERLKHAIIAPQKIARAFINDSSKERFLERMENMTTQAQAGLSDAGVKAMPDDTFFTDLRGWHKISGSFYEAFDIVESGKMPGTADKDQLAYIDRQRDAALKHFPTPRRVESNPSNINFGEIESFKDQAIKRASSGGLTYYMQLWVDTLGGKTHSSDFTFSGGDPRKIPVTFTKFDGTRFWASYTYKGREGAIKGRLLPQPRSNPADPSILPSIDILFKWEESGSGKTYEGSGIWRISESQIDSGSNKTEGFWTNQDNGVVPEKDLSNGGHWDLFIPMPNKSDLITADTGNPPS